MKLKLFTVALFAFATMASCKKDRTCTCSTTTIETNDLTGSTTTITTSSTKEFKKVTLSGAGTECANSTATSTSGNYTTTSNHTCELN